MAKPTFNFNMGNGSSTATAKEVINQIETQEFYNFKIVPYNDIEPNILNDYPISDIEELVREIKEYGLIQPLGLILNRDYETDKSQKRYRLYSGERRYTAIGIILKENPKYPSFEKGIPAMIEKRELSAVDEEIKLILSNKQRDMTEEFKRKKVQRLLDLYKQRVSETGEKISITKKVAEDLHIGERQVRRYNSLEKLLPELKQAFDDSKFNLENASSIANMDTDAQKIILSLIQQNNEVGKEELEKVKQERDNLKKEIEKLDSRIKSASDETENFKNLLREKEDKLLQTNLDEENLRVQIKQELEKNNPDKKAILQMQDEIASLKNEKSSLENETKETQKIISEKEKSIEKLQKELKKTKKPNIPDALKEKLKQEATILAIEKELDKTLQEYSILLNNYKMKYKEDIKNPTFIEKINRIAKSLT